MALKPEENHLKIEELKEKFKDIIKIPRLKFNDREKYPILEWDWFNNLEMLKVNEKILLTPYEQDGRVWMRLWEVVKISDVVVQVLDARNPLLFRYEDLEAYVKEVKSKKVNALLFNKADFLTKQQRKIWAKYFDSLNIRVAFFSAVLAFEKHVPIESDLDSEQKEDDKGMTREKSNAESTTEEDDLVVCGKFEDTEIKNSPKLLGRNELISFFKSLPENTLYCNRPGHTIVALVGYPNVGTKSTISALKQREITLKSFFASLRRLIPSVPNHIQTWETDYKITICGCPGLVMPSIVSSEAEMIINGILPMHQMKDHVPPISLIMSLIPSHVLQSQYAISIPKPKTDEDDDRLPTTKEFLTAYGYSRGFVTRNGQPDDTRSARCIIKDFLNGRLLYCHAPPGISQHAFHTFVGKEQSHMPTTESVPVTDVYVGVNI